MATIVDTYEKDGETINVYESGVHYNVSKGRLIKAAPDAKFTPETSRKAKERLAELKREALLRGAAEALEKTGEWNAPNNLDVVEAIGEAVMRKALNSDNPKQVDAARFILQEAGMSETQTKSSEDGQQIGAVGDALSQILGFLRDAMATNDQQRDVIDGTASDVTDTRNE
jgi:hypothetical protein